MNIVQFPSKIAKHVLSKCDTFGLFNIDGILSVFFIFGFLYTTDVLKQFTRSTS